MLDKTPLVEHLILHPVVHGLRSRLHKTVDLITLPINKRINEVPLRSGWVGGRPELPKESKLPLHFLRLREVGISAARAQKVDALADFEHDLAQRSSEERREKLFDEHVALFPEQLGAGALLAHEELLMGIPKLPFFEPMGQLLEERCQALAQDTPQEAAGSGIAVPRVLVQDREDGTTFERSHGIAKTCDEAEIAERLLQVHVQPLQGHPLSGWRGIGGALRRLHLAVQDCQETEELVQVLLHGRAERLCDKAPRRKQDARRFREGIAYFWEGLGQGLLAPQGDVVGDPSVQPPAFRHREDQEALALIQVKTLINLEAVGNRIEVQIGSLDPLQCENNVAQDELLGLQRPPELRQRRGSQRLRDRLSLLKRVSLCNHLRPVRRRRDGFFAGRGVRSEQRSQRDCFRPLLLGDSTEERHEAFVPLEHRVTGTAEGLQPPQKLFKAKRRRCGRILGSRDALRSAPQGQGIKSSALSKPAT
eukprot:scaffold1467_cov264-Pinguiococcus_pyrenoidosus.AAC.4